MNLIVKIILSYMIASLLILPSYFLTTSGIQAIILPVVFLKIVFSGVVILYLFDSWMKFRTYQFIGILYLFSAGFLYLTAYITEIYAIYLINSGNYDLAYLIYGITQIFNTSSGFTVLLFLSSYRSNRVNPIHIIPMALAIGMLLQALYEGDSIILQSFVQDGTFFQFFNYSQDGLWYFLGFFGSFGYIVIYVVYSMYELNKRTFEPEIQKQQKVFGLGILGALLFSPILYSIVNFINDERFIFIWNFAIANSFTIIAIIIAVFPYLKSENPGYLQPQPIEHLLVIQQNGVMILSLPFGNAIDDVLFSGAISAVSSIMKEATASASHVKKLEFEDKILLTRFAKDLAFVAVIGYETSALISYIETFASKFPEQYSKEIERSKKRSELLESEEILNFTRSIFGLPNLPTS